ncbi:MAG: sulfite exporter TauE/SafE family protein [Acidimicrobiales bacterium]|jgi:sulfite exporter TauE/SafE|nr:sulfite exporter TauE/SafE family protein [Acidimicrobiales bacterium]
MLSSITPLGERGRAQRWWLTATAYILGSALGGVAVGAALGALGSLLARTDWSDPVVAGVVVALAVVALVFDAGAARLRLPRYGRQVNEDWMSTYRGWVYGGGYGLQLGAGLTTIVTAALVYLVFALCLLAGSWWGGALIGLTFGLTRGLALLSVRHVTDPGALVAFHRRLQRAAPRARGATVVAEVVVLAVGIAIVVGA